MNQKQAENMLFGLLGQLFYEGIMAFGEVAVNIILEEFTKEYSEHLLKCSSIRTTKEDNEPYTINDITMASKAIITQDCQKFFLEIGAGVLGVEQEIYRGQSNLITLAQQFAHYRSKMETPPTLRLWPQDLSEKIGLSLINFSIQKLHETQGTLRV